MKQTRKLLAMLLCIAMVLGMATTASAYTIQLNGTELKPTENHTYSVYQIYTGDLYNGVLSNVVYGAHYVPGGKNVGDPVPAEDLAKLTDAYAFAEALIEDEALSETDIILNSDNQFKATGLDAGYYLIVDNGYNSENSNHNAISAYIVQVVDDVKMSPKSEVPTLDKVIGEDYETGVDFNNVSIGDEVPYTLHTQVPSNAGKYDYFYFIINDKLSDGLTFNNDITVYIGDDEAVLGTDYVVYTGEAADGYTFQVALLNAKAEAGKVVEVHYTATLNEDAEVGAEGNPNTADLDYSNNPNFDYDGTNKPDVPGKPNDENPDIPTGKTPESTTITYTTEIIIEKQDNENKILEGAAFTITGEGVNLVVTTGEVYVAYTEGEEVDDDNCYWLLKDGTYTEQDPNAKITNDQGKEVNVDTSVYEDTDTKYHKETQATINGTAQGVDVEAFVNDKGQVIFTGLGAGDYTIEETVVPDGYNKAPNVEVTIVWTAPADGETECTWTYDWSNDDDGAIDSNQTIIVNQKGSTLPETGGIGTTLFYVFGGIMVLGAAVLLVTKKRMAA